MRGVLYRIIPKKKYANVRGSLLNFWILQITCNESWLTNFMEPKGTRCTSRQQTTCSE